MTSEDTQHGEEVGHALAIYLWYGILGAIIWAVLLVAAWLGGYPGFSAWFVVELTASFSIAILIAGTVRYLADRQVRSNA